MNSLFTIFALFVSLSAFAGEDQLHSWSHDPDNISLFLHTDCDNELSVWKSFCNDPATSWNLDETHSLDHDSCLSPAYTQSRKRRQPVPEVRCLSEFSSPDSAEYHESTKRQCLATLAAEIFSTQEAYFSNLIEKHDSSEIQLDPLADDDLKFVMDCTCTNEILPHTFCEGTQTPSDFFEQLVSTDRSFLSSQDDTYGPDVNPQLTTPAFFTPEDEFKFDLRDPEASPTAGKPSSSCSRSRAIPIEESECPKYICLRNHCPFNTESIEEWSSHHSAHHNINIVQSRRGDYRLLQRIKRRARPSLRDLSDERPYTCNHLNCGKTFKTSSHLSAHVRNMHTDDKPYVCDKPNCTQAFKVKSKLNEHQRYRHSDERPYACSHSGCQKAFKSPSDRNRHLSKVHFKTAVKS